MAVRSMYTRALTLQSFRIICSPALAAALIREGQYSELCAGLAAGSTVQLPTRQYIAGCYSKHTRALAFEDFRHSVDIFLGLFFQV